MNTEHSLLLGLDLGTTHVKALVADWQGRVLAKHAAAVPLYPVGEGGMEQDLEEIWQATLLAIRESVKLVDASRIRAIGISSQGGAMQIFDQHGHAWGRVISWLDGRGAAEDDLLTKRLGPEWFLGRIRRARSGLAIGQLMRLQKEPTFPPGAKVGFVGDTIVGRLCGQAVHDGTSCALTLLYNPALRDYDPDLLRELGLERWRLPNLESPAQAAGGLTSESASLTGLTAGIPVSAAIHDQYAAALSCGAVHPGDVMVGTGTAWVLLAVMDRLLEPVTKNAFVCHHVAPGLYGQIFSLHNGGSAFSWALNLLGWDKLSGAEIDAKLESVKPGSEGLSFWPLLAPTDVEGVAAGVKGRLDGLQLYHTSAQVLRSVVEGLVFELNRFLNWLRHTNLPLRRLVMTGGAAASRITPQVIADVTGLPIHVQDGSEGSVWGAVVLARNLVDPDESLDQIAVKLSSSGRLLEPGDAAPIYQQLAARYLEYLPPPGASL